MWHSEDPWEEARPLSLLLLTLEGTERPSHVCISQDNQIEKPSSDKCALSRAEGHFYVSLSLSDEDVEGRLWRRACSRLLQSLVQWWAPSQLHNTRIIRLSLSLPLLMCTRHSVLIPNTHCQCVMAPLKWLYKFRLWKNYSGLSGN